MTRVPTSILALAVVLLMPLMSFAATSAPTAKQAQIAALQEQIAQLQAELAVLQKPQIYSLTTQADFMIPVSQHVDETGGGLRMTFVGFEHLAVPVASTSPFAKSLGKLLLDYSICGTTFCHTPGYPTMTTELWPGQTTSYLNYLITLDSLGTSTAALTVVKK